MGFGQFTSDAQRNRHKRNRPISQAALKRNFWVSCSGIHWPRVCRHLVCKQPPPVQDRAHVVALGDGGLAICHQAGEVRQGEVAPPERAMGLPPVSSYNQPHCMKHLLQHNSLQPSKKLPSQCASAVYSSCISMLTRSKLKKEQVPLASFAA